MGGISMCQQANLEHITRNSKLVANTSKCYEEKEALWRTKEEKEGFGGITAKDVNSETSNVDISRKDCSRHERWLRDARKLVLFKELQEGSGDRENKVVRIEHSKNLEI